MILTFMILLILSLLAAAANSVPTRTAQSQVGRKKPNAFIVELRGECKAACRGALRAALASSPTTSGCTLGPTRTQIGDLTFENVFCPPGQTIPEASVIDSLSTQSNTTEVPKIVHIVQDEFVMHAATPTDLWGIDEADGGVDIVNGAPQRDGLHTCSSNGNGNGVNVWILDTGCTPTKGGFCTGFHGGLKPCEDLNGHGSQVGGIATDIRFGVASGARRSCVKVLSDIGSGTYSDVIKGIEYAVENRNSLPNGDVVNLSLTGGKYQPVNDAVHAASKLGLFFAIAAGNNADNACNYSPASSSGARIFTVQAHDINLHPAPFTNFATLTDECTTLSAPGVGIISFGGIWSGTSMAAPHVAGGCALLLSRGMQPSKRWLTAHSVKIPLIGALDRKTLGVPC